MGMVTRALSCLAFYVQGHVYSLFRTASPKAEKAEKAGVKVGGQFLFVN
jgi:hypothetical protein